MSSFARIIILLCGISICYSLQAKPDIPQQVTLKYTQTTLKLNGSSARKMWGKKAYYAALYAESPNLSEQELLDESVAKRMDYHFVNDFKDVSVFMDSWVEDLIINTPKEAQEAQLENILYFKKLFNEAIHEGDVLSLEYHPDQKMVVLFNQNELARVSDKAFYSIILKTWIGPHPPSREFKRALLNFPVMG